MVIVAGVLIAPFVASGVASAQAMVTPPEGISLAAGGAVCSGTGEGQTYPVSITLPSSAVNDEVDVALLLDDTGSFEGEWSSVSSTFSSVVDQLQAAMPSVSFGFGVSMFKDYGGAWTAVDEDVPTSRPFILNQPIVTAATAGGGSALDTLISNAVGLASYLPGSGGDLPEASIEGLDQLATGAGFDGNGNGSSLDSGPAGALATQETPGDSGDVPPFSSNVVTTSGSLGGIGWRPGALHIAIVATDVSPAAAFPAGSPIPSTITSPNGDSEPSINFAYSSLTPGVNRTGYVANTTDPATNTVTGAVVPAGGATVQSTVNALNALGIRVLGMGPGDAPTTAEGPGDNSSSIWLSSMARLTGATDSDGNALVFDTSVSPTDLGTAIVNNVETSVTKPVNVGITTSTLPTGIASVTPSPTTVDDVALGGTASFDVTITGDGTATTGSFDINFVDATSEAVLGSVPVTLDCSMSPPPPPPPPKRTVTRVYGTDAIGTAIAVSQAQFPNTGSAGAVVLARSDFFSDAAAGAPLAAEVDGPLLLTPGASLSSSLDPRVLAEIQRVLSVGRTIYVLGGDLALSPDIDTALAGLGYQVVRVAGADEYATAVDIAVQLGNPQAIFEATGLSFYDSASAIPAAIESRGAILFTDGTTQAPETAAYLGTHQGDRCYAIGGPLAAFGADHSATPIYGEDLYDTSAAVASNFFPHPSTFGAATSATFTDAVSAGPALGLADAPILLVPPSGTLPDVISQYLFSVARSLTGGRLYGGPFTVGNDVLDELYALINGSG